MDLFIMLHAFRNIGEVADFDFDAFEICYQNHRSEQSFVMHV